MSDIFREVEEDVRREKLEKFWKAHGDYIIALAATLLIGIAGYELWQRYETAQRDKASVAFAAGQRITDARAAAQAFADLAKTAPGGYRILARMEQANTMLASGQRDSAVEIYKEIAEQDKGATGAVARLREAWAMADTASRADLASLLAPLEAPNSVWKQMADEILAYADYRDHDLPKAAAEFTALANDPGAPDQLRQRARAMGAFLKAGGAKDFGTVPPVAPSPAPAAPATGAPATP